MKSDVIKIITEALNASQTDITDISALKTGMTNRSFLFSCHGRKYIMRIPGEGTDQLINRSEEAEVYRKIGDKCLCDEIKYLNPNNGYKLTTFFENARNCDAFNPQEVRLCMARLREFHDMKLTVGHSFDLFEKIDFYESLWDGAQSIYRDYDKTKNQVLSLRPYIEQHKKKAYLTHIDAVADNFIFVTENGQEKIKLIDWEYAGMQDQDVDLAMFCIYSLYDQAHIDALIDAYYTEGYSYDTKLKIYCYIAVCGLLWSNWCEYKRNLGVEFGEYALKQYRYAKEYYRIVDEELNKER